MRRGGGEAGWSMLSFDHLGGGSGCIGLEFPDGEAIPESAMGPVDLASSSLLVGEEKVKVRGEVANNMKINLNYVEFSAKIYNAAGDVMGGMWTNETDISKGSQVRFDPE